MKKIGLEMPCPAIAHSMEEALQVQAQIGFPTIVRPSFMGLGAGGIAYSRRSSLLRSANAGWNSVAGELLIEESRLAGKSTRWRWCANHKDNCIIVCG